MHCCSSSQENSADIKQAAVLDIICKYNMNKSNIFIFFSEYLNNAVSYIAVALVRYRCIGHKLIIFSKNLTGSDLFYQKIQKLKHTRSMFPSSGVNRCNCSKLQPAPSYKCSEMCLSLVSTES